MNTLVISGGLTIVDSLAYAPAVYQSDSVRLIVKRTILFTDPLRFAGEFLCSIGFALGCKHLPRQFYVYSTILE